MSKFKKENVMKVINCLALVLVAASANSACFFYFHQPEFPKAADKFRQIGND
ncbi:cyclic lactone autoinducer peptide [Lachnobacterium bovis]|jgi:cyclic lactone autoinducer peptide|uniref:Cyclic lactone autoinducer peptide n=1 Tax=Lachnobacterium bovis DSM 14045 TaxID=1122142 RepID=A0A1H3MR07_9FIRM|nr:cyclic lactone autoinducer peptide [Lachnobacterium bovis]SDY79097.1 cyclic lactone autoinducer peptide [Lachnobacterium bovis DSM 14045]